MSYSAPSSAKPFKLEISDQDLADFKQLLQLSRIGPPTYESRDDNDRYLGVTRKWLVEAKDYWLLTYDWRAEEAHINSFPNYTMDIEGLTVHFVALFSQKKDAVPILFMHGWPGSFIEFLPMAQIIRDKYAAQEQPYHIVIASLPGYTLSSGGPLDKDWSIDDTARVMDKLMRELGFSKYVVQGGDVGSMVGRVMAAEYDACAALHLNFLRGFDFPPEDTLPADEKTAIQRANTWRQTGTGYALEHGTRPTTIGFALDSNPLSLLAWIGEKFLEWSDTTTTPPLTTILTNTSLYWFTHAFPRSIYPYRESFGPAPRSQPPYIHRPLGFSYFRHELLPGLKQVVEQHADLVFYRKHERGGHFAALERPEVLWRDVEEFVNMAWKM